MRANGDHRHLLHARLFRDFRKKRAAHAARGLNRRKQPLGQAKRADDVPRPIARHGIDELAGGSDGVFRAQFSREQVHQKIRHKREFFGDLQRRVVLERQQLIQRVELQKGQPRLGKNFFLRHNLKGLFHHAVGHVVAIMHRQRDQIAIFVQQAEIHAPGVHANAIQLNAHLGHLHQGLLHFKKQPRHIPDKAPVQNHRVVGKAVHFGERQLSIRQFAQHRAPAGRAKNRIPIHVWFPSSQIPSVSKQQWFLLYDIVYQKTRHFAMHNREFLRMEINILSS